MLYVRIILVSLQRQLLREYIYVIYITYIFMNVCVLLGEKVKCNHAFYY